MHHPRLLQVFTPMRAAYTTSSIHYLHPSIATLGRPILLPWMAYAWLHMHTAFVMQRAAALPALYQLLPHCAAQRRTGVFTLLHFVLPLHKPSGPSVWALRASPGGCASGSHPQSNAKAGVRAGQRSGRAPYRTPPSQSARESPRRPHARRLHAPRPLRRDRGASR